MVPGVDRVATNKNIQVTRTGGRTSGREVDNGRPDQLTALFFFSLLFSGQSEIYLMRFYCAPVSRCTPCRFGTRKLLDTRKGAEVSRRVTTFICQRIGRFGRFFFQFYFPSFVGRFHENFNHDLSHLRFILIDLIFKIKIQISFLNFLKIIEN